MAYADRELYSSGDYDPNKRIGPKAVGVKTFAADAAATELAVGTPVAFDSANFNWVAWSASGTGDVDEIKGFVYPNAIQLDASDEVQGQVMLQGRIHFDDIVLPTGETSTDLRQACRTDCLERGLIVTGLDAVR
jgi:hypothetical protein